MADLVPFYRITDCCSIDGNNVDVFIDLGAIVWQDGIYSRSFTDLLINSSFTLEAGKTYLINQGLGPTSASLPTIDVTDVNLEEAAPLQGFSGCNEASIEIPCSFLYFIEPCCSEYGSQGLAAAQVNLDNVNFNDVVDGVYVYNGPNLGPTPLFDTQLINGACYTITRNQNDSLLTELINFSDFSTVPDCNDAILCAPCPISPGIHYIKYTPCCGGDPVYVRSETMGGTIDPDSSTEISSKIGTSSSNAPIVDISNYLGVFMIMGTNQIANINGLYVGQCYTATLGTVGDLEIPTEIAYLNLPLAPYQSQLNFIDETNCLLSPCPTCFPDCYELTDCNGITINSQSIGLETYIDTYVTLNGIPGCWLVQLSVTKLCAIQAQPVTVTGSCVDCSCLCYEVNGYTGSYTYIDCNGKSVVVRSTGADKFCAGSRPNIIGKEGLDYTLTIGDACVDDQCVDKCFLLTNCDPTAWPLQDATLTSTLQSLSQYVNAGEVVVLSGYEGCWAITEEVECDCPIDVTVIRDYRGCEECLGITAYKLFNCEKINEVVYTTQDFSAYVGQVIKDDCACWVVEEINYQPPSETTIVDPILFTDCTTCLTTYYQLEDCDPTSLTPIIITSTNLAGYVGSTVQIDGCTGCYIVLAYALETQPANSQEVTVTLDFTNCDTCNSVLPKCSTVFNNTTEDQTYTFINANGDSEVTDVIKSGHSSLRYCVQRWDDSINPEGIFNFYGDCTVYEDERNNKTGFCVQYFPNNRKVRPGYNTPICSADKYDKITCNAADIM